MALYVIERYNCRNQVPNAKTKTKMSRGKEFLHNYSIKLKMIKSKLHLSIMYKFLITDSVVLKLANAVKTYRDA